MALFIVKKDRTTINVNIPFTSLLKKQIRQLGSDDLISYIQADGDELVYIIARFNNLPYTHRICIWRGEMARFIADNIS